MPVQSRRIIDGNVVITDDDNEPIASKSSKAKMTMQEQAIYIETDALQIEMGNLVARVSDSGTYTYKTARQSQRKDRYSSLALGNSYITELESKNMRRMRGGGKYSIGVASVFN